MRLIQTQINNTKLVAYTYTFIIFDVDISPLLNNEFHCVFIASSSNYV